MVDSNIPKIRACFLLIFPVGIGLKHVLVINASKSDSYHIFKHPAAPAPKATKTAGKAQHTRVEDEANSEKKLAVCSSMLRFISIFKF